MSSLLIFLSIIWVALMVVLAAWTLWFQAYIYSEPVEQIYWRAPAAGSAVTLFLLLWVWLDYGTDGRFRGLFEFSVAQSKEYPELTVETEGGHKDTYERRGNLRGGFIYRNKEGHEVPTRPKKVTVTEDKKPLVFEPERDAKGNYLVRPNQPLRYINKETGQVMTEGQLGQISTFRWWWLFQNLFVNLLHFAVWCVSLWLLLNFQFWHAFGMAVVAWLAVTLFLLPPLLNRAEEAGKQRADAARPTRAVALSTKIS